MSKYPDYLRYTNKFRLDMETGQLFWRVNTGQMKSIGEVGFINSNGYRYINCFGKTQACHRIIWLLMYGYWPKNIDHINRIKSDNRPINLRDVSKRENGLNRGANKNNMTGLKGVYPIQLAGGIRWKVVKHGRHVGYFATAAEGVAAYDQW